ncbi:hypothetical protein ACJX0J_031869, partial [Zea mays]
ERHVSTEPLMLHPCGYRLACDRKEQPSQLRNEHAGCQNKILSIYLNLRILQPAVLRTAARRGSLVFKLLAAGYILVTHPPCR